MFVGVFVCVFVDKVISERGLLSEETLHQGFFLCIIPQLTFVFLCCHGMLPWHQKSHVSYAYCGSNLHSVCHLGVSTSNKTLHA